MKIHYWENVTFYVPCERLTSFSTQKTVNKLRHYFSSLSEFFTALLCRRKKKKSTRKQRKIEFCNSTWFFGRWKKVTKTRKVLSFPHPPPILFSSYTESYFSRIFFQWGFLRKFPRESSHFYPVLLRAIPVPWDAHASRLCHSLVWQMLKSVIL